MDALRKLNNAIEIDPEVPEYLILRSVPFDGRERGRVTMLLLNNAGVLCVGR